MKSRDDQNIMDLESENKQLWSILKELTDSVDMAISGVAKPGINRWLELLSKARNVLGD